MRVLRRSGISSAFLLKFPHERGSPIKNVLSGQDAIDILTFQLQQIAVRLKPGLPHAGIDLFNVLLPLFLGGGHRMRISTRSHVRYLKAKGLQMDGVRRLSRLVSKRCRFTADFSWRVGGISVNIGLTDTSVMHDMESDSLSISIAMLKEVLDGETYDIVAARHGVTRTAVEKRIKVLARTLCREVGIDGLNESGVGFVQRLRQYGAAITAALERYTPDVSPKRTAAHILNDEEIELAIHRTRMRSPCPRRDVALFYVLLISGARPLEIARLEVGDYLNADGSVKEASVIRADVAVNRKIRPLFFASMKAKEAIDDYLAERRKKDPGQRPSQISAYRGFDAADRLFLTESGTPFEIVSHGRDERTRFLCRGIHDAYRKIFRRIGLEGLSALHLRRTIASRMLARGAAEEQIGEVLGIGEMKAVRELLPDLRQPLQAILRELV